MMRTRAARVLGLRQGEGHAVGLAVAMSFFVSAGLMIGQSGIEALFFARYGVGKLPVMYLILGATMFLATIGFGALLGRVGRGRACIAIPVAIAALATAGRVGLAADLSWITQVLWLLQGVGYFLLGLAVWGLAGIVTDTRQAKRFFPLIGAGSVLGYVVGGLITKPLASWLGTPNLLLVWVATLVAAVVLGIRLLAAGEGDRPVVRTGRDRDIGPIEQLVQGLRYVSRSLLLRWLALGSILFSLLFFSLYLPFSRAATLQYPEPDDLAGFFGLFFGLSTGVAFLMSLFLTNRLLERFGVPTVMLVLPLLYVVAFGVLAIDASFAVLMVFRFAQVAWLSGGASTSTEAVINTVPPERRDQTRAFIYGGPTQVGTVLAGVIALVGEGVLSPTMLYGVGLVSAVLATVAMIGVRRAYPRELVQALREGRPSVFGTAVTGPGAPFGLVPADPSAMGLAIAGLSDPDPRVRRVSAHVLGDLDDPETMGPLVVALGDEDAEVRATAIRSLARSRAAGALADVLERCTDADASVRIAMVEAIGAFEVPAEVTSHAVGPLLHDPDPFVRARAAALLVGMGADPTGPETLIDLAQHPDDEIRAATYRAMRGARMPALLDVARAGLGDPAPPVRAEAARTLATIDPDGALEPLVAALADDHPLVREAAADGLSEIGPPAVDAVVHALGSPERRQAALTALERLPLDGQGDVVHRLAVRSVTDAVESHRLGSAIEDDHDEALLLLKDSLLHRSDLQALTGLRAAALLGGGSAMSVALENLSVSDPAQRANALEVIESVARRDVVRPLLSMWDGAPSRMDQHAALDELGNDPDDWIRACLELATTRRGGPMTRTLTTLSPMERVLFLRKVPLFAELPPPDLQPIAAIAEEQAFADDEAIAEQGDVGNEMHVIVSGDVSVVVDDGGSRRVVATRSSGDVVGEMSIMTNEPRIAGLLARGPVRVLSIDRRRFESILRERPEISLGVIRVLCQRLTEARGDARAGAGST
jgi:HEAT repeat protein